LLYEGTNVGTLFSYLFDNFDVLALILAKYVDCSCNCFNTVMFWKKVLPCQECNTQNLKSEKSSVFWKKIYTPIYENILSRYHCFIQSEVRWIKFCFEIDLKEFMKTQAKNSYIIRNPFRCQVFFEKKYTHPN
jgi:hypothetical protein